MKRGVVDHSDGGKDATSERQVCGLNANDPEQRLPKTQCCRARLCSRVTTRESCHSPLCFNFEVPNRHGIGRMPFNPLKLHRGLARQ
jgi:hypothetical protein